MPDPAEPSRSRPEPKDKSGAAPNPRISVPDALNPANRLIVDALRGLQYGQVTVTVQDGVIVQVDRLERWRTS